MFKAIATTVFIFGSMIIGYFLFAKPRDPVKPLPNVAITLIDVLGDGNGILPGQVTTRCLSQEEDNISDQFVVLIQKIAGSPGNTQYLNGAYVTLAPSGRRPIFQVRFPDPKYCADFVDNYEKCYATESKISDPEKMMAPVGTCVKLATSKLTVTENWEGLIEEYSKKRQR
ncbi:MAG: hypothetical protein EOP07_05055 [Proteobacteria bacterium]|nr:MAG: hypothetical protein EOP07_05055 [Pseudomonadota bacterium]